jgi:hypothetical protein
MGAVSNGKNAVIELTGTITGNVDVTVPSTVTNKVYIIKNSTSGAFAVTVLVSGQTGISFSATDKGSKNFIRKWNRRCRFKYWKIIK